MTTNPSMTNILRRSLQGYKQLLMAKYEAIDLAPSQRDNFTQTKLIHGDQDEGHSSTPGRSCKRFSTFAGGPSGAALRRT
jgi:hypothetical protein